MVGYSSCQISWQPFRAACPLASKTSLFGPKWSSPVKADFLLFFNWRIIVLQCCVGLCHTTTGIRHKYTHGPSLLKLSPIPPNPSRSLQSSGLSSPLSSPCHIAASHQRCVLHMVMGMFQCYSLNSSHSLLPLLCLQVYCLHLHLYSCLANTLQHHLSRLCKYAFIYDICFLFLIYFSPV